MQSFSFGLVSLTFTVSTLLTYYIFITSSWLDALGSQLGILQAVILFTPASQLRCHKLGIII